VQQQFPAAAQTTTFTQSAPQFRPQPAAQPQIIRQPAPSALAPARVTGNRRFFGSRRLQPWPPHESQVCPPKPQIFRPPAPAALLALAQRHQILGLLLVPLLIDGHVYVRSPLCR
jgi:hypothetical protein